MRYTKLVSLLAVLAVMGAGGCAHNPRPESPEQRAERQAQSLQAEQGAIGQPQSIRYAETRDGDRESAQPEAREQPTRAQVRRQTAAARGLTRPMITPVTSMVYGVTGLLR